MNVESWQAGLCLGSALTLALNFGARAFSVWRRKRGYARCTHCGGLLGDDGRAEFPVERLQVCAWCGDTWPQGARHEGES